MKQQELKDVLNKRKRINSFRSLKLNNKLIDFCSNDYLGFSRKKWNIKNCKNGSTGSRLIRGNSAFIEKTENQIAKFYNKESSLIFNSGYNANIGFFSSVPQKKDTVIYDELSHASIRDGLQLGKSRNFSFKHNNLISLEEKISQSKGSIFVAVESIYSMDGDEAPLLKIAKLCEKHKAKLVVDEAHATGIFGKKGEGLCESLGINTFAQIHTFGKALGSHGACIIGSNILKNYLINFARSFIYTTALPEYSIKVISKTYKALPNCYERKILNEKIVFFKNHIKSKKLIPSNSSIQSFIIKGNNKTNKLARKIQAKGFDVRAILYPTVAKGSERLRICLHAFNSKKDILQMCELLKKLI